MTIDTKKHDPHFLFIITPPYSGSTALAKLINTSKNTMLLHPTGEGQWLIPELCNDNRWDTEMNIDYSSVYKTWLNEYISAHNNNSDINVIIEKSPPNMVRIRQLITTFNNNSLLANNRNPMANCASILYRNYDAKNLGIKRRSHALNKLLLDWLKRSYIIKDIVQDLNVPLITYEQFCDSPSLLKKKLTLPEKTIESIDFGAELQIKDYPVQRIINQNQRQIAKLTQIEKEELKIQLKPHNDLLSFFDYNLNS